MTNCGASQAELDAEETKVALAIYSTQTKIAANIFATQTAEVPTLTPTATSTPTPTHTPTSTPIPLGLYESEQYPFSIEYPAEWSRMPKQAGITESFGDIDFGTGIFIAEEDLIAIGYGETTLEEYVELSLFVLNAQVGFELISEEQTVNANGLTIVILEGRLEQLRMRFSKLIYLHEGKVAFNATYLAFENTHKELEPMIEASFNSFDVTD